VEVGGTINERMVDLVEAGFDRAVPVMLTSEGLRALSTGKPIANESVQPYL
jgi:hypothetical protein